MKERIITEYKNELVAIYKSGLACDWNDYHYHCGRASGLLTAVLLAYGIDSCEHEELSAIYTAVLDAVAYRKPNTLIEKL